MKLTSYLDDKPFGLSRLSLIERLSNRKDELEADLDRVNEAITAIRANPDIQHVLDCISKV